VDDADHESDVNDVEVKAIWLVAVLPTATPVEKLVTCAP